MKHTLVALMQDHPGVLNRVVSLFRRRGYNIESLAVGPSETAGISRMTLSVDADNTNVEQVTKQLYRLIEVLKVSDVTADPHVARELLLAKIYAPSAKRQEVSALAEAFSGKIVDVSQDALLVELSTSPDQIDNFIELVRPFGLRELVRTGRIAMVRGTPTHSGDVYVKVA
ncbi:MAG: acetolactate synthase small subunit [Herpetosiphon sp.]